MKKGPLQRAFFIEYEEGSLAGVLHWSGSDIGRNGDPGLFWHRVGVDRDRLGLLVLLALGIEFDFNLTLGTWRDGFFWTLRNSAATRAFATVQNEGSVTGVGELENVGHHISFVNGAKVMAVLGECHGGDRACRFGRCRGCFSGLTSGIHFVGSSLVGGYSVVGCVS